MGGPTTRPAGDTATHLRALRIRARRAGYRLVDESRTRNAWVLVDADDGEPLFAAPSLAEIEQYLNE
ncbi:hypothetical protein IU432_17115 [Nocardia cyriacigeorgica]|nr:hypothetical protein [Nocardia cyriacigeorgica]MBF6479970.1 hypothetical protein [Nocardia cyriacigeorgica]MBF6554103.1 hypothetical protein [Nocardia cyriacigeorgica]